MNRYIYAWILTEYLKGNIDIPSQYISMKDIVLPESRLISLGYGCKVYENNPFYVSKDNKHYHLLMQGWQYSKFFNYLNSQPYLLRNGITITYDFKANKDVHYFLINGYLPLYKSVKEYNKHL